MNDRARSLIDAGRIALDQINDGFETLRRGELARSVVTFAQ